MRESAAELPTKWPWLFHGFRWYAPRYLRKHFTAVRLANASAPWPTDGTPVLVAMNHPSWHDPITATLLSFAFPTDSQYAAIDAQMLSKNAVFAKIGFVPVEMQSLRGAANFVRTASVLLSRPNHVLWVTAQGRFADVRPRPLAIKSGVGHLAKLMRTGWVLPVALEYPFWDEPKPEALVLAGEPIDVTESPGRGGKEWATRIEEAMTDACDRLAIEAQSRDPVRFTTILDKTTRPAGRADLRRRMLAALRGRSWQPADPVLPQIPKGDAS